jgi:hypothetical protein
MSALGIASLLVQLVGTVLVVTGLYHRHEPLQQEVRSRLARIRSRIRRLLRIRGRQQVVAINSALKVATGMAGEFTKRPGTRDPDASTEERLGWLERAADLAFDELGDERDARRTGDQKLGQRVTDAETRQTTDRQELEERIAAAMLPEARELLGAVLLVVGLLGSAVVELLA